MTMAEKLKRYKERANLKNKVVTAELGIDNSELWRYEHGQRTPSYRSLLGLSRLYGLSLDEYIDLLDVRTIKYPDSRLENIEFSSDDWDGNILKVLELRGMTEIHLQELVGGTIIKQFYLWNLGEILNSRLEFLRKIINILCLTKEEVALVLCYDYRRFKLRLKTSYELEHM